MVSLGPPEVSRRTCVKDWKALMTLMMMAQGDPNQMVELLHPEFSAL